MTDIPGDASTTVSVSVGGTITDTLEAAGDHDWIAITLTAGQPVVISLDGITLHDPYLYIRDSSGTLLFQDDDISSGVDLNSEIAFNPDILEPTISTSAPMPMPEAERTRSRFSPTRRPRPARSTRSPPS